jgi:hypothetical protein
MTEPYGARVAAMLTADPDLQFGTHAPACGHCKSNQLSNSIPIEHLERIVG